MIPDDALRAAVDAAFAVTGRELAAWPDPHPDRSPLDEEYSRLTDPARWRIVGARADAWIRALVDLGLAVVEAAAEEAWEAPPPTEVTRADRLVPHTDDAPPLVLGRSRLGEVADAGVTLGVGDPATLVTWIPECGCDACDSGSADELEVLDEHILSVVAGTFRRLSKGDRTITVLGGDRWSATGLTRADGIDEILANPTGWSERSGQPWGTAPR